MSHADVDQLLADFASDAIASSQEAPAPQTSQALPGGSPQTNKSAAGNALKRGVNYSHEAMIDLIIGCPGISQNDIAKHFGYTPSWISTLMASDAFQAQLAKRRSEVIDPVLLATVEHKFKGILDRAADVIMAKLDKPVVDISDQFALKSFEVASKAAGYGARVDVPPVPATEVHLHLETIGARLDNLLTRRKAVVESTDAEVLESLSPDA